MPVGLLAVQPGTRALEVSLSFFLPSYGERQGKKKLQQFQCGETKSQEELYECRHRISKISYTESNAFHHSRDIIQTFTTVQLQYRDQENCKSFLNNYI